MEHARSDVDNLRLGVASAVPPVGQEAAGLATRTPAAPDAANGGRRLTVLAAASLTGPFMEPGRMFEAGHAGVRVEFNFAGSQQLVQQLDPGAPADVFASASPKYMQAAVQGGRVDRAGVQGFAQNRLVVIFPKDNPAGLRTLKDLAKTGLKLDFATRAVPVGQYSLDSLDKAGQDPAFGPGFKAEVLKNVVSYEGNVKSVLAKVTLGEADAGIVYASDISGEAAGGVGRLDIPDALNSIASYPIAPVRDSPDPALAFVDLALAAPGQQVLAKYNFAPAASP